MKLRSRVLYSVFMYDSTAVVGTFTNCEKMDSFTIRVRQDLGGRVTAVVDVDQGV